MKSLFTSILASTLLFGCMSSEDEPALGTSEQNVSSYVAAVAAATTTFTSAVATNTRNNAAAVGLSVSAVKTGYSARNTLGATTSGSSQVLFATKAFSVGAGTYQPGLYEIGSTSRGPTLYYFSPTGRVELGIQAPGTPPSTSVGGDLCAGAGVAYSFCNSFVACALYDQGCPDLPCCTYVG